MSTDNKKSNLGPSLSQGTCSAIKKALHALPPREEFVITMKYWNGLTLEDISYILQISWDEVFDLEVEALQKLKDLLDSNENVRKDLWQRCGIEPGLQDRKRRHLQLNDRHIEIFGPYPAEIYADLRRFVEQLPSRQKECVLLYLEKKLPLPEIARRMNVSRRAANKSVLVALGKMERHLQDEWDL